jgi:glycosyltransferase involved in cell wall biosynthesis
MLGLPVIASHVEPYAHSIVQGESGFLAKNDKDWLKYLRRLIDNPALRDEIGGRAKTFAEERTIEAHVGLWAKAYGIPLDAAGSSAKAEPAASPAEA